MNINGIESVSNLLPSPVGQAVNNAKPETDFASWLSQEVSLANQQINQADEKLREFALGKTDNLHQVMMSLEKAKTSFELVVEVRNRVLEGYQQIMRMQI